MLDNEFLWTEKYRPQTIAECILPERLKKSFTDCAAHKEIPNMILSGTSGVGKTTVALALCQELGIDHIVINSSEERGIDLLRTRIRNFATTASLEKSGLRKCIILDEADYLTPEAQAAMRGAIEEYSSNCTFILTCNFKSKLIEAIHSRMAVIDFRLTKEEKQEMAPLFLKRIEQILRNENVQFERNALVKLILRYFPDYRRMLNELQFMTRLGDITLERFNEVGEVRNLEELIKFIKTKDFAAMRKWVVDNSDVEPARIIRMLYDNLNTYFKPTSIPPVVLILSRYQYQSAFVADQEINLVACLTEIMVEGECL